MSHHSDTAADINPWGWSALRPAVISLENEDTLLLRNITFFIRHNEDFRPQPILVNIVATAPDSSSYSENFLLSAAWRDSDSREFDIPYRQNVVLNMPGTYTFTVVNLSGIDIKGITALGLRADPVN